MRFQSYNTNKITWAVYKILFHEEMRIAVKISEMSKTKVHPASKQVSPMMNTIISALLAICSSRL